jgi:hypothetical protein
MLRPVPSWAAGGKVVLKPAISSIEKQMVEMARMIVGEAGKRYPAYNWLVDGLGIRGNIKALESLAELIQYVGQPMGLRKMINLLGLFRPSVGERRSIAGI